MACSDGAGHAVAAQLNSPIAQYVVCRAKAIYTHIYSTEVCIRGMARLLGELSVGNNTAINSACQVYDLYVRT